MKTTTLEKAFDVLRSLPTNMQEEIGTKLLSYTTQWRELKAGLAAGTDELARGAGIEISDINAFAGRITNPHDHS